MFLARAKNKKICVVSVGRMSATLENQLYFEALYRLIFVTHPIQSDLKHFWVLAYKHDAFVLRVGVFFGL